MKNTSKMGIHPECIFIERLYSKSNMFIMSNFARILKFKAITWEFAKNFAWEKSIDIKKMPKNY